MWHNEKHFALTMQPKMSSLTFVIGDALLKLVANADKFFNIKHHDEFYLEGSQGLKTSPNSGKL